MEEGKFSKNQEMVAKAIPILDDQNGAPEKEEISSHSKPSEPDRCASNGPMSNGFNKMTNTQGLKPTIFESDPRSQKINSYKAESNPQSQVNRNKDSVPPQRPLRENDLYMPIAYIVRILRRALPPHAKLSDESKDMVQECVSEFINFITSEANELCHQEHLKTIAAEDLIGAMYRLGFDQYVQPLSIYLHKYRESEMIPPNPRRNEPIVVSPTTTVLPPYAVLHPHYAMFRTDSNGKTYHNGSGMSNGPLTIAQVQEGHQDDTASTSRDGNGPSLALGINAGPNGNEYGGPSGSSHAGLDKNNPYGNHK